MQTDTTAERVALNQHAFREANERVEQAAAEIAPHLALIPFLCECPNRECTEVVRLTRGEYEDVRQNGKTFFVAPGHEVVEVDGVAVAKIAARLERFSKMQKLGEAGEVAESLDRRRSD